MIESKDQLKTRYKFFDFIYWNTFIAIPVITACIAIFENSVFWFIVYIILGIALIILVYRFYCTHCPHYIQGENTVKCLFFWGVPKFFEPKTSPLNLFDKAVAFIAPAILILFPLFWLKNHPAMLVIYILSLTVFAMTIRKNECSRCIYFHCPVNPVPEKIKTDFKSQ